MMAKTLKFILRSQIKSSKVIQKSGGFTLIELLVALLIAFLILTPLLGFMVSVLSTDRQEQAKANSEQEIQTALNFISRDLQQAVYIYDADGIEAIKSELRYPNDDTRSPVLVFWKREFIDKVLPANDGTLDDTFVYSLVAYYLIKDTNPSDTWSNAARIARWQIKDGVRAADGTYITSPSAGFVPFTEYFDEADSLKIGMEKWQKSGTYDTSAAVLIDYVDQSTEDPRPVATCPDDTWSEITPADITSADITGFYVCVDSLNTTAQVFIRGNALARIENNVNRITYNANNQTYFPTTSVRVEGRGFLFR